MQANIFEDISIDVIKSISKFNNEPTWMLKYRLESLRKFQDSPVEKSNLFTKYSEFLTGFDLENIELNKKRGDLEIETEHRGRNIDFLQVDDQIIQGKEYNNTAYKNLILTDISSAIKKYPELVKKYLNKTNRDKLEYLADALFKSGIFFYVPKGTKISETIRYINRQESLNQGIFNKNMIILEDSSNLSLFIEHYSSSKHTKNDKNIFGYSQDIFVEKNAKLMLSEIELFGNNIISLMNKKIEIKDGGTANLASGYLGGNITRTKSYSHLIGTNSRVDDLHIVIGTQEEKHDLIVSVYHSGTNTKGVVDVKGVMSGRAQMTLKGMNKIENQAHNADTFLGGHAILLGGEARANIIPGLEIDNRNVKAKHSAAVAPIDEDLLFYLQSRALDKGTSIRLIITGFLESIVKRIEIPSVKEQITEMIEFKFNNMSLQTSKKLIEKTVPVKGKFEKVCKVTDIPVGTMKNFDLNDKSILISNIQNKIFATGGQCTHQEVNLEDGFITGMELTCPVHLSKFDLNTGQAINLPAVKELQIYNVKIENNEIYIEID